MSRRSNGKSRQTPIIVRHSGIQGRGVFAAGRIRKGRRIIEYVGQRVTHDEADSRYDDDAMSRHHTFLFEVDESTVIDAARDGNEARFINHSCDPNCEAVNEDGRIYIEAIRNIQPGVELTYDYAYPCDEPLTPEMFHRYRCACGAPNCRGTILKISRSNGRRRAKSSRRRKGE